MNTTSTSLSPINSTIVRIASQGAMATARTYFAVASRLRPNLARRQAERLFTTPPRPKREWQVHATARRDNVLTPEGHIALWQAGPAEAPAFLVSHGWGGLGAQLGPFITALLARGFRVVWFDHPGHGESEGRRSALPAMVTAIRAIADTCGPFHAAIGHSLGAAAIALALRDGLSLERVILISPPASINDYMHGFARRLGLTARVRDAVRFRLEQRYGRRFADIDRLDDLARLRLPALIVHDADDSEVPFAHAERIAASLGNARLIRTHGLGHYRLLRDPAVIASCIAFAGGAPVPSHEIPPLPTPAPLY
jgi:pimeloyl-ACP methyl ester carboxylesterase